MEDEENLFLGINVLKRLRIEFEKGMDHCIKTFYTYKLNNRMSIIYSLMDYLYSHYSELFPFHPDMLFLELNDAYEDIVIEKKYIVEYLKEIKDLLTDDNLSEICKQEVVLFERELENWTKLADYYSEFRKRGVFMLLPRAIMLINKMALAMDNIISIEESIIAGSYVN